LVNYAVSRRFVIIFLDFLAALNFFSLDSIMVDPLIFGALGLCGSVGCGVVIGLWLDLLFALFLF